MDLIIEFVVELALEGVMEVGTNKKVPKWLRYPALILILLIYTILIGGLLLIGINLLKTKLLGGIVIILIDIILLLLTIYTFIKKIKEKKN